MKFVFPFLIFAAASVSVRGIRWIKRGSENNPSGFDQNRNQSEVIFGLEGLGQEESDAIEIPVDAKEEDFKLEKFRLPETSDQIQTRQTLPGQGYPNQGFSNQGYPNPGQGYPGNQGLPGPGFEQGFYYSGNDISSLSDARLELSPGSGLAGSPGQLVNIVFLLFNLGEPRYFFVSVNEQSGGSGFDQVTYPGQQTQFLNGLSEQRPYLHRNETRNIVISIKVPQNVFQTGTNNKTITLEIQPEGVAGNANMLIRRFYFTVTSQPLSDRTRPSCRVVEDSRNANCAEVASCRQRRWAGKFEFYDLESGLRTLSTLERVDRQSNEVYYSYNNFVIGTKLPAQYSFQASCCINSYSVAVFDLAGNEEACIAGEGAANVQFGSLQIAITVVVIMLALVIVIGVIVFCLVRKKRNAELAEMRASPQAR